MTNATGDSSVDDSVERSLRVLSLNGGDEDRGGAPCDVATTRATDSNDFDDRPGSGNSATSNGKANGDMASFDGSGDDEAKQLLILYKWLDTLPLPSIKRSSGIVARDFSDGTAVADIIHYYFPTFIEQHNYVKTSNSARKKANWEVLMTKVLLKREPFKRVFWGLASSRARGADIEQLCAGVTGADGRNPALEGFLWKLMQCCLNSMNYGAAARGGGQRGGGQRGEQRDGRRREGSAASNDVRRNNVMGHGGTNDEACGSDEGESETDASMIQTLIDENSRLSNMVIKQDGIIRLMQAKIDALERELGI